MRAGSGSPKTTSFTWSPKLTPRLSVVAGSRSSGRWIPWPVKYTTRRAGCSSRRDRNSWASLREAGEDFIDQFTENDYRRGMTELEQADALFGAVGAGTKQARVAQFTSRSPTEVFRGQDLQGRRRADPLGPHRSRFLRPRPGSTRCAGRVRRRPGGRGPAAGGLRATTVGGGSGFGAARYRMSEVQGRGRGKGVARARPGWEACQ